MLVCNNFIWPWETWTPIDVIYISLELDPTLLGVSDLAYCVGQHLEIHLLEQLQIDKWDAYKVGKPETVNDYYWCTGLGVE